MKKFIGIIAGIAVVFAWVNLFIYGQALPGANNNLSIFGSKKDSVFASYFSTATARDGEAEASSTPAPAGESVAPAELPASAPAGENAAAAPGEAVLSSAPAADNATAAPEAAVQPSATAPAGNDAAAAPAESIPTPSGETAAPSLSALTAPTAGSAYDLMLPTSTAQGIAGQEFLEYLDSSPFLHYSKDRWLQMRREKEGYQLPEEKVAEKQETAPAAASAQGAAPLPPGISVDLPYESQLSISGRKLIGVAFKSTMYDKPDGLNRINSGSFDMNQELQVRIKGKVGRKIGVNVDFDDTREDKRDISVVYKGDPDEFVQEAAFGDITMSLPSTEFVGYSRQLFGVKLDTKFKGLHTQGFFSRTKGFSEVKRFTGNTTFQRQVIQDTSYIDLKYYKLRFNNDSIVNGSVKVYLDDRNPNNNNVTTSTGVVVETLTTPPVNYTGDFDQLVAGQDYTVDYDRGIIMFRNKLAKNHVVTVDYQRTDGTWLHDSGALRTPKIIKEETNSPAYSREMKTFYSLGNVKIIRDNGRGNFILKVVDQNNNAPSAIEPGGKPVPQYPQNISVDFENGVFNIEPPDSQPFPDSLYTGGVHTYNFLAEYRYRVKFVNLRPGIVPQSERVTMDGKLLKAGDDYFIDYDAGIVTFLNEEKINENTVIEVSYDYAPFGGVGGSTLVGVRSQLDLNQNVSFGSSFIYDFAARTQSVPDIRTTPASLMVWEGDMKTQNVKVPYLPLIMSAGAEYAMSSRNPNIMNKAMVESMEGVQQEDSSSLIWDSWHPASNPSGARMYLRTTPPRTDGRNTVIGDVSWNNEEVLSREINPNLQLVNTDEKQQVLSIDYSLARSSDASIIQSLSNVGLDFSKKLYLETWIKGDGNGEELSIAYGSFNEDADGDGKLDTEDLNGDGTLNSGEDIGWEFNNPDGTVTRIGAGNGKIDSEDRDANGTLTRFDTIAQPGPYGPVTGRTIVDDQGIPYSKVTWTGWKHFKIPLNITSPDEWKGIKQVRLTLRGENQQAGNIKIANLAVTANRWEAVPSAVLGSTVTVSAVNNETDPDYAASSLITNPDYQSLYETQNVDTTGRKEQALSLKYTVPASTTTDLAARLPYGRAYDLSNYKQFKFFVNGRSGSDGDVFFIQAGNDANYFEYSVPITWTGWRQITVYQHDANGDRKPERWTVNENGGTAGPDGAKTRVVGAPSFQNIAQIKLGVRATGPKSGEVWVNEIHVADSYIKAGDAWRANADFTIPGWSTFGARRKAVDRNFETFSAGVYNRDSLEDSLYFNLNRLSFMPLSTKFERIRTVTPSVVQTQNDLVSLLDEGRVTSYTASGSGSLNLGRWLPRFDGQYARSITDTQQIQRLEDRETVSGGMNYENPLRFALLPTALVGNYSISNSYFRVYPSSRIIDGEDFLALDAFRKYLDIKDYHTLETTESWGGKTPFQFWPGFTLTPSYNLQTVRENNADIGRKYSKSASQDVGATSSLRIFPWLQPNFSYNINTKENYNLAYNTGTAVPTYPGQTKYIERNANGEINWSFQARDLFNYRWVQSLGLSSSFRIQNSDSYDNVPSTVNPLGVDNFNKLWIDGKPLIERLTPDATSYIMKSMVRKNDVRISGRYNPFEAFNLSGRLAPIRSLSANFTYTNSEEDSNILNNKKFVVTRIWPDLLISINQFERVIWADSWVTDSQLNFKHQFKTTKTENVSEGKTSTYGADLRFNLLRKLDLNFSFNTSGNEERELTQNRMTQEGENTSLSGQGGFNLGQWRITLRYERSNAWQKDGTGKFTSDLLTNSYIGQVYSDMSFPRGLPIPFTNKTLPLTNRFIFNSTVKYVNKHSNINVERDNTDTFGLAANAEYEVSQNFRLSLGLGYNRVMNRVKPDENYSSIEASSRLTIQF